jgi:hypothetical protein
MSVLYCKGSLKTGYILVPLSPQLQVCRGLWEISVKELIYDSTECPEVVGTPTGIALNFVKSFVFSQQTKRFETIFSPVQIFSLEASQPNIQKTFSENWVTINNFSEELRIYFKNLKTDEPLICNCKVYLLLYIKKHEF